MFSLAHYQDYAFQSKVVVCNCCWDPPYNTHGTPRLRVPKCKMTLMSAYAEYLDHLGNNNTPWLRKKSSQGVVKASRAFKEALENRALGIIGKTRLGKRKENATVCHQLALKEAMDGGERERPSRPGRGLKGQTAITSGIKKCVRSTVPSKTRPPRVYKRWDEAQPDPATPSRPTT